MSQVTQKPSPIDAKAAPAAILRAKGVRRAYRMGDSTVVVLKNVDLTVRAGEFLAIEGRSGSGKSTLLHILGALETLDEGTVEFDGRDYTRLTAAASREKTRTWVTAVDGALTAAHEKIFSARFWIQLLLALALTLGVWAALAAVAPHLARLSFRRNPVLLLSAPAVLILALPTLWLALMTIRLAVLLLQAVWLFLTHPARTTRDLRTTLRLNRFASRLRNRQFGFVFQFYHLLPELDVLENTMLAPMIEKSALAYAISARHHRARATEVLTQLGMSHRLAHRPNQLSGGERQRVAIARALMNKPRVLFADEPTGNLDYETGRQIMGVLEKLHQEQGQTIIMVTHDRALAREADRVVVLKDGKLSRAEEG